MLPEGLEALSHPLFPLHIKSFGTNTGIPEHKAAQQVLPLSTTTSMSEINIHVNPNLPPGTLPPPYFRPHPSITKGPKRNFRFIIFGLLIDYEVGREWFKKIFNHELNSDHTEDLAIPFNLNKGKTWPLGAVPAHTGWSFRKIAGLFQV